MTNIIRLSPPSGVKKIGTVLFAARMQRPQGVSQPVNSLAYLAPNLLKAGYEVLVSQAETFSPNSVIREGHEVRRAEAILKREIAEEKPDFVAFPVYDNNAPIVHEIAEKLQGTEEDPALIFGSFFITINPGKSKNIFGTFPNVILINGEAEYALPEAIGVFQSGKQTDSSGIFVRKNGKLLGGDFMTRISLSAEEHEALEVNFDIYEETHEPLKGVEVTSSRGCFEGCTFCASSGVFRRRHITWSPEKKLAIIRQARRWLQERGGISSIGFPDDSFFYNLREGTAFLRAFRDDPLSEQMGLVPQISFGPLFRPDGSFIEEIPNLMLRPDGTAFVRRISAGIDFWSKAERARNKGKREGRLTEEQIKTAVAAFTQRKIVTHTYWILGDEQTTLTSFSQGLLFLAELLIDHGPYFMVDMPEPLEPRTGTPFRKRLLSAEADLSEGYLTVADRIGSGDNEIVFYHPILPPGNVIEFCLGSAMKLLVSAGRAPIVSPDIFLATLSSLAGTWMNTVMNKQGRDLVEQFFLKQRKKGRKLSSILTSYPVLKRLPTEFSFLGLWKEFEIEELLELVEIERTIPRYLKGDADLLEAERLRRNPHFHEEIEEVNRTNLG